MFLCFPAPLVLFYFPTESYGHTTCGHPQLVVSAYLHSGLSCIAGVVGKTIQDSVEMFWHIAERKLEPLTYLHNEKLFVYVRKGVKSSKTISKTNIKYI